MLNNFSCGPSFFACDLCEAGYICVSARERLIDDDIFGWTLIDGYYPKIIIKIGENEKKGKPNESYGI